MNISSSSYNRLVRIRANPGIQFRGQADAVRANKEEDGKKELGKVIAFYQWFVKYQLQTKIICVCSTIILLCFRPL
ncbi:hypothetical protein DKX38_027289 [Salix brachista]|uniref:Uncharacterized protein n=1 Tax=Salix brachista TaxID=2182728 RepID=A0A5N5JBT7_9ROSI|nr:hypothetical protein DKX38_027289 [Salix brachista]